MFCVILAVFDYFRLPLFQLTRFSWCVREGGKSGSLNAVGVAWSASLGRPGYSAVAVGSCSPMSQ